jgi:hypothetical protein
MEDAVHQGVGRRDTVRLDELGQQRLSHAGISFPPRFPLEVLSHRRAERSQVLELSHFSGKRIVQRG